MVRGWQPCICPDAAREGGHYWLKCLSCPPDRRTFHLVPDCRDQIRSDAQVWETEESGDFDSRLSPGWLLATGLALGRTAEDEVKAGRMTIEEASSAAHHSFLRLFGVQDPAPG